MVNISERNGVITLLSRDFDLKIDNNRKLYFKKKEDTTFKSVKYEIPPGELNIDEKKNLIHDFYIAIEKRRREMREEKEESS